MCSNVMENGINLTATLESQSPMIHFQARETGAVLRFVSLRRRELK